MESCDTVYIEFGVWWGDGVWILATWYVVDYLSV